MERLALNFDVVLSVRLAPEESLPHATSYLTSDVPTSPSFVISKPGDARIRPSFVVDTRSTPIPADASLCVQAFCTVHNHKGETCRHRCGFASFALRGLCMATVGATFQTALRAIGPVPDGRGTASIAVTRELSDALHRLRFAEPSVDDMVGCTIGGRIATIAGAMRAYHASARRAQLERRRTSDGITMSILPLYVQSCGAVAPSVAFLLLREPPLCAEEHYLRCLEYALARSDSIGIGSADMRAAMDRFVSTDSWDRRGSLLMDVAMAIPAACPYLFDTALSVDGGSLVNVDEFTRTARITLCGDCEDGSCEACLVLWDLIARTGWTSRQVAMLHETRKKYIATVTLKAVTRPAQQSSEASTTTKHSAHACCDLVPVWTMREMLKRDTCGDACKDAAAIEAIEAIAAERGIALRERIDQPTRVVVGEGTGLVSSFVEPSNTNDTTAELKATIRQTVLTAFPTARFVSREDLARGSGFYLYTVSAIVNDTLFSPGARRVADKYGVAWVLPQVVYHRRGPPPTHGAPHNEYITCSPLITAVTAPPVDRVLWSSMWMETKFEHPVPGHGKVVDTATTTAVETARKILGGSVGVSSRTQPKLPPPFLTICIPATDLDASSVSDFVDGLARIEKELVPPSPTFAFAWTVTALEDGVTMAIIHVSYSWEKSGRL